MTAGTLPMCWRRRASAASDRQPVGQEPCAASQASPSCARPVLAKAAVTPKRQAKSSSRCQSTAPIMSRDDSRRDSSSSPATASAPSSRGSGVRKRPTRSGDRSKALRHLEAVDLRRCGDASADACAAAQRAAMSARTAMKVMKRRASVGGSAKRR